MTTTTETLYDDDDISQLGNEARTAGDDEMAALCDAALGGDAAAWARCEQAITDARAMRDGWCGDDVDAG